MIRKSMMFCLAAALAWPAQASAQQTEQAPDAAPLVGALVGGLIGGVVGAAISHRSPRGADLVPAAGGLHPAGAKPGGKPGGARKGGTAPATPRRKPGK